jgi:hypothetical protein
MSEPPLTGEKSREREADWRSSCTSLPRRAVEAEPAGGAGWAHRPCLLAWLEVDGGYPSLDVRNRTDFIVNSQLRFLSPGGRIELLPNSNHTNGRERGMLITMYLG